MAVLVEGDRFDIWAQFMRDLGNRQEKVGSATINKHQLRDAVNAIDTWIDTNMTSFNQALPEPAKSELSAKQKACLFMMVINRRWEVS